MRRLSRRSSGSAELTNAGRRGEARYAPHACPSIRSLPLERSRAPAIVEGAVERIALNHALNAGSLNPPPKRQHVPGLRSNHEVLFIDRAFDAAGLVRSFEMTFDHRPLLLKVQVLGGGCSVRILAVQGPLAGNIGGQLLCGWLLRKRRTRH